MSAMSDPLYFKALEKRYRDLAAESPSSTSRESLLAVAEDYATRADWTKVTGTILGDDLAVIENLSAFLP
jgi:hypothetical protein